MSEENVEIAKRFNAVSRRGNVEDYIEGGLEFFADDIVITNLGAPLDIPPTVHGREAARRSWERLTQVFDDFTREIEEWVDEDDWVITVGRWVATGEGSGLRVERRDASALRFDRGKIVEWIIGLPDKQAALEAAGLSE